MGNSYYIDKEFKHAVDCYDQVLRINPKDINAQYGKGFAYNNLKEF